MDFKVAFDQLSEEQRESLILVGASGFSYEDAGKMCGVATGIIKSRVNRARAKLT
jgi:RNA polymerase sigma-70 factor (ECF subfamily)